MPENTIPKQFIRIWLGPKPCPQLFEDWWEGFKNIHPDYKFITITDNTDIPMPKPIRDIYEEKGHSYSAKSDVLRILALYEYGGIYLDVDVMPIKSFDSLLGTQPFIGKRSSKSFGTGVIGSPARHPALLDALRRFPQWYSEWRGDGHHTLHGPAWMSKEWFGREDITHLEPEVFYPYDGFMAPKTPEKIKIFQEANFPPEMIAAHYSNCMKSTAVYFKT